MKKNIKAKGPKNVWGTVGRLLRYLKEYKFRLVAVFIFLVIASLTQVAGMFSLKYMINDYILPLIGQQHPALGSFIRFVIMVAGIYFIGALAGYIYSRLMVDVSTGVLYRIRVELFSHMQKLPLRFFDTNAHGEIMSRFTNDTDALREMFSTALTQVVSSLVTLIGIFVAMLVLSPMLTILTVVMLVIMIFVIRFLGKRSRYFYGEQQKAIGKVNGYLEEMIEGQRVVKVFNHEQKVAADFEELNERQRVTACGSITSANMLMPIMMNLSYGHFALTAMFGSLLSIQAGLDLGTIGSFLQLTKNFSQPVSQVTQHFNTIIRALAGAERIFDVMDLDPETDNGTITLVHARENEDGTMRESAVYTGQWAWKLVGESGQPIYTKLEGNIVFDDVSFGYSEDKTVLKHINIYANTGQKVALVGSTGAGKTTITNLLNRFYDITDGTIYYDGIDIKDIQKGALRKSLSMVLQDTHLFTGTIEDNIRYGRLDATRTEVVDAAELANADGFIEALPKRYDTPLSGSGSNLSQGERQLLSIARAAVANPPTLILDEATSSIDTRTESLINKGMQKLMNGRTSFVIAHRLSTIQDSDVIMVLEHGEIIERGSHESLLEKQGRYYQLYTGAVELD